MALKKIKFYYPIGFLSLLFLFPLSFFYLKSDKAMQPRHCITMDVIQPLGSEIPDCNNCYKKSSIIYVDLHDSIGNITLIKLYQLKRNLENVNLSFDMIGLKLPEFKIYGDFITAVNIFMKGYPHFAYDGKTNLLLFRVNRINGIPDLTRGSSIVSIYRERNRSFSEKLLIFVKRSCMISEQWYESVTLNSVSKITFILWLGLVILNLFRIMPGLFKNKNRFPGVGNK